MRVSPLLLLVIATQTVWAGGLVSAATSSSPLTPGFGMAVLATDLATREIPSSKLPSSTETSALTIQHTSARGNLAKSLSAFEQEGVTTANASVCDLLGKSWCLALRDEGPNPSGRVLGVSHSVGDVPVDPDTSQTLPDSPVQVQTAIPE